MSEPEDFDQTRYAKSAIATYEAVYGRNFVSPGGKRSSTAFLHRLNLEAGMKVLDIGCGIGGPAFQIAAEYGCDVDGIDVSRNMIEIARERCAELGLTKNVRLRCGDFLELKLDTAYDVVHSRDVFLHIHDKNRLFALIRQALTEGGLLAFTDYCSGPGLMSDDFREYISQRNYCLHTLDEYQERLRAAGFVDIRADDKTDRFIDSLNQELDACSNVSASNVALNDLSDGWRAKRRRATLGEQRWGWFTARAS